MGDAGPHAVAQLLEKAKYAPEGPAKVAMLEEAVRRADVLNDQKFGLLTRNALLESAMYAGQQKKALVAFSWCLAFFYASPDRADAMELMWQYRWIADIVAEFSEISRDQIETVFTGMEEHLRRCGTSIRPVLRCRCNAAVLMGDPETARVWLKKWLRVPGDWTNDCKACDVDSASAAYLRLGDLKRARELARPIVETEELKCGELPHLTLARMAEPCLAAGHAELAEEYHNRGYALSRNGPEFLESIGQHMSYLAAAGKPAEGIKLIERHLSWLAISGSTVRHYRFFCGARAVLGSAIAKGLKDNRKLRLPKSLPIYRESGEYSLSALLKWADAELDKLVRQLDTRNGNSFYAEQVAALRSGKP